MKKIYIVSSIISLLLVISLSGQAQTTGISNNDYAKWSLGVKGGLDIYRISPTESITADVVNAMSWTVPSVFVEYSPNSNFGLGLEGGLFAYNRKVNDKEYLGNTVDALVFGSINLANLVAPYRGGFWKKINFYSNLGLGLGFYTFKTPIHDDFVDRGKTIVLATGLNIEFALGKSFGLLLEGQYRAYTKSDLGGATSTNQRGNDAAVVNIGLRWKIGGEDKTHVRNVVAF